jgi:manganese/zinc/iron transport system permease protein
MSKATRYVLFLFFACRAKELWAQQSPTSQNPVSLTDRAFAWPSWEQWKSIVLLEEYNTRIVVLSVAILGIAAGLVGSFTLLRKRALIGDALAHASLPGIAIAFLVATSLGANGKSLPILLVGASLGGLVGVGSILLIQEYTRLKQDTILGIVLSVFFGLGAALLGLIQQMETGSAAGLETFIYGKTASIKYADANLIFWIALCSVVVCVLLFKELKLLCFDPQFAGSSGMSTILLDSILMALVVAVTMVGLQAVGLILVVALLVIPPAAARFWTDSLWRLTVVSCIFGLVSGILGAIASALLPKLPSGAMVVLVCAFIFLLSMAIGTSRGTIPRLLRRRRLNRNIDRQHLLRGMYELLESEVKQDSPTSNSKQPIAYEQLLHLRSWSTRRLKKTIAKAAGDDLVRFHDGLVRLTQSGLAEAARLTRQHRLWELFLIHHADIAPARVDRDADDIEHVLEPEIVDQLELLLDQQPVSFAVPADPHQQEPTT